MLSSLFQYYWDFNHPATLVVLAPLVLWFLLPHGMLETKAGWLRRGFSDCRRWSVGDALVISLATAHCIFYLCVPNFADYGEAVIPLLAGNYLKGASIYSDWT